MLYSKQVKYIILGVSWWPSFASISIFHIGVIIFSQLWSACSFSKKIWLMMCHVLWHMVSKWTIWSFNIQPLQLWYSFVREGCLSASNQALQQITHYRDLSQYHCTLHIAERNSEFLLIGRVNSIFSPVTLLKSLRFGGIRTSPNPFAKNLSRSNLGLDYRSSSS